MKKMMKIYAMDDNQTVIGTSDVDVRFDLGLPFTEVIPIVNTHGWILKGVGPRGFCWWRTLDGLSVLVGRQTTNRMLDGESTTLYGIINAFPSNKPGCEGQLVYKFISLWDVNMLDTPRSI